MIVFNSRILCYYLSSLAVPGPPLRLLQAQACWAPLHSPASDLACHLQQGMLRSTPQRWALNWLDPTYTCKAHHQLWASLDENSHGSRLIGGICLPCSWNLLELALGKWADQRVQLRLIKGSAILSHICRTDTVLSRGSGLNWPCALLLIYQRNSVMVSWLPGVLLPAPSGTCVAICLQTAWKTRWKVEEHGKESCAFFDLRDLRHTGLLWQAIINIEQGASIERQARCLGQIANEASCLKSLKIGSCAISVP